jgi:hypothetical protein
VVTGAGGGAVTVTRAEALFVLSARLVTFIVKSVFAVTVGARKSPALEIAPALTDQLTAVLVEPVTLAVNCCEPPETRVAVMGRIEITGEIVMFAVQGNEGH